jgi:tRNA (cytidine/uridine-2'-O-)-methyltransferase
VIPGHPQICLFQPEIPQNTGNIGRLAAATQSRLHIIQPTGFSLNDKNVRRAGLDYWPFLDVEVHQNLDGLLSQFKPQNVAFFSARASRPFWEMDEQVELLVFGRETTGLPPEYFAQLPERFFTIPIFHLGVRSLNLANAVSVITYHQLLTRKRLRPDPKADCT